MGEEELPQDTAFTRNTSTTETKEEIRTEASYTYTMDGAEHEIAAGDTATITFTYAQKEEVTPEIASIEVTGEAVDTTGAAIQGDYAFPLAVGTNDLSKTAPYIQGYEYQYAEIGTDKITSIDKEVLEAGSYAYYVDGELLKEDTKITYVYQEDEDYTEKISGTCGNLTVTVSASKEAKLPEGTSLQVTPVASTRIPQILDKVSALLGENAQNITGVLYDITLVKDGREIQPKTSVHVTMKFDGGIPWNVPEGKQITDTAIVHLHGGVADVVTQNTENAEFETEGFSVYGMVAAYGGETGTPVYSGTEDLTDLVKSANLYLAGSDTPVSGEWKVKANTDYRIRLSFAEEDNNNDKQFSSSGNLYYQLPDGVNITTTQNGSGAISVEDNHGQFRLPYTYKIDATNGKITITLDTTDENYKRFLACGNASLYIDFSAQFTETETGKISFGPVEKTVTVDHAASLTVDKKGEYNPATNKMEYTVTVTSSGYNTDVEVTDTMTGSLLTFDGIDSISASSSRTDNSLSTMTKEEKGNGFKAVIPSMKDGETVTLTYTASVDLKNLQDGKDGNTKKETGNTVSAKSNQNKDPKTKEFYHAVSAYTSIEKNVDTAVDDVIPETKDGQIKYYRIIPWKITYNKDRYVSVAGNKIIDEIKTTDPRMEYYGDGIQVEVTEENGTTKESRKILWNDLTSYNGQKGWTYTIPEGDTGNYSYTITYNTKVDVTDIIKDEKVQNEAKDNKGHSSDIKETTVGPRDENKADLTKTGVTNGNKADWTITIKVPANGLTKAELIDELPSTWSNNEKLIDQYGGDLSVSGAPKGTTYEITLLDKNGNETSNAQKAEKVKVVFYQNEQKTPGIAGNGKSLTDVTVTLSTTFNSEWPSGTEHKNQVWLDALYAYATVSPSQKKITKSVNNQPEKLKLKNGQEVWAYRFSVEFEGVTGDTLSFTDTFDTTYLKLLRYSDEPDNYQWRDANKIYEGDGDWNWSYLDQDTQDQYFTSTGKGFSFSYSGLPHNAKNPKNKFRVAYILYIDPDKVSELNQITAQDKGKHEFTNTATSEGFGSTSTSFTYKHATLTKNNTVTYEPDTTNPTSATAHFTIEANKEGFAINGGNNLTLTDTLGDNLSLIYSTIKVTPKDALVKQQTQGRNITFTIKDQTSVTITYDAKIIKTAGNSSDTVSFSNTANLQGESVTCNGQATYKSATGGTAQNYRIKLIKVDSQNEATPLKGAVFGLYTNPDCTDPVQNTNLNPVTDATFTTDDQGIAVITGDSHTLGWTLVPGETYYVKEITAPAGYVLNSTPYQFCISETYEPDYDRHIYYNGDELRIRNTKACTSATLQVKKDVSGEGAPDENFQFTLARAEGNEKTSETLPETESLTVSVKKGETGSFGEITYTEAGEYWYTIKETKGRTPGMSYDTNAKYAKVVVTEETDGNLSAKVTYSATKDGATENSLTVTNTYEVVSVPITKTWNDDNNRDGKRPDSITVNLFADGTKIKSQKITAADNWKYEFKNLPKYANGKEIVYKVTEDEVTGYTTSVSGDMEKGFTITNRYTPETVQVAGSKNWNDSSNAEGLRPESITIRLYANGSEIGHKTVTEKDGWSWNWTGLNRYDTDHKEISYTISEDAVDGYTSSISGYNVTNTVNKPQVGSVILTKVDATTGTALAGAVFDLYRANNTKVGTYTTNAGGVLRVDGLTFGDYYFVETKAPEGYALESQRAAFTINAATTVSAPASVRVTNKPVDEKIGVSAAKVWDDENNTDGVRPSSVTFRLFADGVEIGSAQASEANGWTVSFGNLPKTRNGVAISYAVKEDEVGNYYEASYETGLGSDGSYVFTVKNYRETDKHYEERTGSVRGANRNKPSNGGVAGAGRGRGTGDESDMTVYGTVSGASLLALIVWMIARRKRAGKGTK